MNTKHSLFNNETRKPAYLYDEDVDDPFIDQMEKNDSSTTFHSEDDDESSSSSIRDYESLLSSSKKKSRRGKLFWHIEQWHIIVFILSILCNIVLLLMFLTSSRTSKQSDNVVLEQGWVRPPNTFGLIHIAKTAGSEINGNLTMHYERVCGNKGWSYDAISVNERKKSLPTSYQIRSPER
jgi:hypothetical protein